LAANQTKALIDEVMKYRTDKYFFYRFG